MGLPCPDCGAQPSPTEIDIYVQRRQQAAEAATLARQSPVDTSRSSLFNAPTNISNLGEIITHTSELIEHIERAASLVANEADGGPAALESVAREITYLELWIKDAVEFRPLAPLMSLFKLSATQIVRLFDTSVNALVARDIATVQHLEEQIQESLDEAALAAETADSLLHRIERIVESTNPISAWLDEAVGGDIFSALEQGKLILAKHDINVSGSEAPLLAVVFETIISSISDSDRFWSAVYEHVNLLNAYRSELFNLVRYGTFAVRNDVVIQDILHTARRAISMSPSETIREEITEVLDEGHQLVEQPLKLYLGIACAIADRMSFDASQGAYMSELIDVANAEGWHHISRLIPSSKDLRNAFAHRDYEVTDNSMVRLSPARCARQNRTALVLSSEAICDAVIAVMEACGVMQIALTVVLGDDVQDVSIKHSPFLISTLIEGLLGWSNVELDVSGQKIIISAICPYRIRADHIASVASFFKDHPGDLILRLRSKKNSKEQIYGMPLPKLALWNETQDEFDKMVAFLDLGYHMTHNDKPIITLDHIRKFTAFSILNLLANEADSRKSMSLPFAKADQQVKRLPQSPRQFTKLLATLKRWKKVAERFEISDLAEAIQYAIQWKSSLQTNLRISNSWLDPLLGFMELEVDPVNKFIDIPGKMSDQL